MYYIFQRLPSFTVADFSVEYNHITANTYLHTLFRGARVFGEGAVYPGCDVLRCLMLWPGSGLVRCVGHLFHLSGVGDAQVVDESEECPGIGPMTGLIPHRLPIDLFAQVPRDP